jgi:hypothetical protein
MLMRVFAILLLLILHSVNSFGQGDDVPQEFLVKAKYLLNIPLFTEMASLTKENTSFTICLAGDTPLESILLSSKEKLIKGRPLAIRRIKDINQMESCQMLFIASSERHRLQALLTEAHNRGILTIGDMRNFAHIGGIVSLQSADNRFIFDLNLQAADKASIKFSTSMLKLARDVIK